MKQRRPNCFYCAAFEQTSFLTGTKYSEVLLPSRCSAGTWNTWPAFRIVNNSVKKIFNHYRNYNKTKVTQACSGGTPGG